MLVSDFDFHLPEELIARQSETPGQRVTVVDLTSGEGDYREALGAILEADSVAVW